MVKSLEQLLEKAMNEKKKTISVAVAQDKVVLEAVLEAVHMNIVDAILVGDEEKIRNIAKENSLDLSKVKIVNVLDIDKAAAKAVELVSKGEADYLMKGLLGTANLLRACLLYTSLMI